MNPRYERGRASLRELDKGQIGKLLGALRDVAPDFAGHLVEFAFGDIYARPGSLDKRSTVPVKATDGGGAVEPRLYEGPHTAARWGA